jgi:hypothetical protein
MKDELINKLPTDVILHVKSFVPITRYDWKKGSYINRNMYHPDYHRINFLKEELFMRSYFHYMRRNIYIDCIRKIIRNDINIVNTVFYEHMLNEALLN